MGLLSRLGQLLRPAKSEADDVYEQVLRDMMDYRMRGLAAERMRQQGVNDLMIGRRLGLDQSIDLAPGQRLPSADVLAEIDAAISAGNSPWPVPRRR